MTDNSHYRKEMDRLTSKEQRTLRKDDVEDLLREPDTPWHVVLILAAFYLTLIMLIVTVIYAGLNFDA